MTLSANTPRPPVALALLLTLAMAAVILAALGFQYIGHYIPCALCLLQRWPYYIGVPIAALAVLSALFKAPPALTRTFFAAAALAMLISVGLGVYHAGVEWRFWQGPSGCSTSVNAVTQNAGNLLEEINTQHGPSCTDASLRVLGLSFAGWNVIASLFLAGLALRGALKR